MNRICDGTGGNQLCPRRNPCESDCHFNNAGLKVVQWDGIQTQLVWATGAFVGVVLLGVMLGLSYVIGRVL